MSEEPRIPEMLPAAASREGPWDRLRRNRSALALGLGAFVALAFIGILLLPPLEEAPAAHSSAGAPLFGDMEKWKAPKIERGDPLGLIRNADGLAGVDGGRPLEAPAVGGSSDEADPAPPQAGQEAAVAATGPVDGTGGARKLAGKSLASLKDEQGHSPGRSRLPGGGASTSAMAGREMTGRAGQQEARGPMAVARRRVSAALRRLSRAGEGMMAGLRRAFGRPGEAKPFDARSGSSPFAAAPGGTAASSSPGGEGGAIGGMGGGDSGSKSGGATTPLGTVKGTGPTRDVSGKPAAKPVKCAVVKGALEDFCRAFDIVRNVNARYHSTSTPDKDLLVPLMERSAIKYDELNKQYAAVMDRFKNARFDCENCDQLGACLQVVNLSIGTGDGAGIMREFQDAARASQKGIGTCAARGYQDEGTAAECHRLGLEAIEHDRKAKLLIEQHLVLVNAKRDSCKADETKGPPAAQQRAKEANRNWVDFVQANLTAFQPMYDYLKPGWCTDPRIPCLPIRLGKMREAWQRLGRLESNAQTLAEFIDPAAGYTAKVTQTKDAMRKAIMAHERIKEDEGRNCFHGVHHNDVAASAINSLDGAWEEALTKCGLACDTGH